jgi:hypothetical protein
MKAGLSLGTWHVTEHYHPFSFADGASTSQRAALASVSAYA